MKRKSLLTNGWHFTILILIMIGLIVQLVTSPGSILIPLVILGIVYYLYKRPPMWLQRMAFHGNPPYSKHQAKSRKQSKKKTYRFRVIDGKKKSI